VLAQLVEGPHQELLVGDRLGDLQRGVPRGQHREVLVVEVLDGLGVVHLELVVGDLVDPRAHELSEQLAAGLTTDGLGDYSNGFVGFDEAERHLVQLPDRVDGTRSRYGRLWTERGDLPASARPPQDHRLPTPQFGGCA
jgi:hypothetical protein